MDIYEERESNVRSYCRLFDDEFDRAEGSYIYNVHGKGYLDFFCGAGSLNYGHNHPAMIASMIDYLKSGGVLQAPDFHTRAKAEFLTAFDEKILRKRNLPYKVMFCGPTGTNAVEAALKLARKATGRRGIFAFEGSFHGMTEGALSVTSSRFARQNLAAEHEVTFLPYCPTNYAEDYGPELFKIEKMITGEHSGVNKPAAVIVETVQGEGGVNRATEFWLMDLDYICKKHGVLLIVDDIQAGCYRTGSYFSFERAGIVPDIVLLSKSISGVGLPMSLLLMRPELDLFAPGEHNGTFRGNQLAFVTAKKTIELTDGMDMERMILNKSEYAFDFITKKMEDELNVHPKGKGLFLGMDFSEYPEGTAERVAKECFGDGLLVESCGPARSVLKLMPPLNVAPEDLTRGLEIIYNAARRIYNRK